MLRKTISVTAFLVLALTVQPVLIQARAQSNPAAKKQSKKKPATKRVNPAYELPDIDPTLPNVLLIGDSISIGYTVDVRKMLKGQANVFRPPTNCGPTTRGVESIDQWIGDRKWDLIHFNFGLHDLKYMGPNGKNLADPKADTSFPQVPIDEYVVNLRKIATRLKSTGAVIIWRETTPVPKGSAGRVPGDSKKYNEAAAKVIEELGGIQTDPFFAYAQSIAEMQKPANVHYTPKGSEKLGEHVANLITSSLK